MGHRVYSPTLARTIPDNMRRAARYALRQDVKAVMMTASNEDKALLWKYARALDSGFNRYPSHASELRQAFWQDCRSDGVPAAIDKWRWGYE